MTSSRTPFRDAALGLRAEILAEEPHQRLHLAGRATPVVGGEGEEREDADAQSGRGLDHPPHRVGALAVAGGAPRVRARQPSDRCRP